MIKDTLGSQGKLQLIPTDHDLYHIYFDFDGPPKGSVSYGIRNKRVHFLEGVWIQDRLVLVYTDMGYVRSWNNIQSDPQLKFGVNMVIYALTQRGGDRFDQIDAFYR